METAEGVHGKRRETDIRGRQMIRATSNAGLRILCAAVVLSTASRSEADVWVSNGPEGGRIEALAVDPTSPNTVYAGTGGGVFKSTDGGGSWTDTGLPASVFALAIDPTSPSTLYAAGVGGLFKSTDGAGSWSPVSTLPDLGLILALAIDPASPGTVYAATSLPGGFKPTDGWGAGRAGQKGLATA